MRIYKVNIEHTRYGRNWRSKTVEGRTFNEAVKNAQKSMNKQELIESM
jgi:hypothetical protein